MTLKELKNKLNQIRKALDSFNIVDAASLLLKIAIDTRSIKIQDKVSGILDNYNYMISYMLTGAKDESRIYLRDGIIEQLRGIVDRLDRDAVAKDSNDIYSEMLRNTRVSPIGFSEMLDNYFSSSSELSLIESADGEAGTLKKRLEDVQVQLFNRVWTSLDNNGMYKKILEIAVSEHEESDLSIHLVNAMILSLFSWYDEAKIATLLDIYLSSQTSRRLKARALTGLVLAAPRYKDRISRSKPLINRLSVLHDDLLAYRSLREILMAILRTRDTERISKKMEDEVLPELMRLRPDIIKKMREGDIDSPAGFSDDNPEWEEMMEKTGLGEKLRELNEMQSSGADLLMVTFANLKQFPFFNLASNWFLPFDATHSELPADKHQQELLERLTSLSSSACDSDKFSLGIALGKMPDSQRAMIVSQLDAQFSQMKEELSELKLRSSEPEFDEEVTKTVRDFYRFFKLFRKKEGFKDPFESTFRFDDIPVIGEILSDDDILKVVAEFYFKRGYYQEALELFRILLQSDAEDGSVWEKIGFCYQNMKFFENAAEAYSKAELLHQPSLWLIKKMAYVYGRTGDYHKALEKYKILLEKEPEDYDILVKAGFCSMKVKDFTGALKYYYHADYLSPDSFSLVRSILWCEFMKGEYAKCLLLHTRIPADERTSSDFLTMGHISLINGEYNEALVSYRKAIGDSFEDFEKSFIEDLPVLEKAGMDRDNALIILDRLRMERL